MHIHWQAQTLLFKHPFTISKATKTVQPTLVVSITQNHTTGYGEAAPVSYYNVTVQQMIADLQAIKPLIEQYTLSTPTEFYNYIYPHLSHNLFALAALDIAVWDWYAHSQAKPISQLIPLATIHTSPSQYPHTNYTIGLDTIPNMVAKVTEFPWHLYKIKLNNQQPLQTLQALRQVTNAPFMVDVNEGWTIPQTLQYAPTLKTLGVTLLEQPVSKHSTPQELAQLHNYPIPLVADEACVTHPHISQIAPYYQGINIKLAKCGGISPAIQMIQTARNLNLSVMVGCMNENAIGSAAIAQFLPHINHVDMDGPLLQTNTNAHGITYHATHIQLHLPTGLGISPIPINI